MMRSRLLITVALIGFCAPLTGIAQSYMTAEDVLLENDGAFLVPSHQRGAQWSADLEQQLRMDRHPSIIQEPWDPVHDDGLPPPEFEPAITEDFQDFVPPPQNYGGLDPLTARLLARLAQQNSILASTIAQTQSDKPLAQTGPAAVLSVIAMVAAVLWTLRRARMLQRFVQE